MYRKKQKKNRRMQEMIRIPVIKIYFNVIEIYFI